MKSDVIIFSHMMKTAGTSLLKSLIEYYGSRLHYVSKGTHLISTNYDKHNLELHLKKKNTNLVAGHCFRPHLDFEMINYNLRWFTIFRNPCNRYLSHYMHVKYFMSEDFTKWHYKKMKNKGLVEWEKADNCANYQCKFISGEANAQKAIDILEEKFDFVGILEEFDNCIESIKNIFNIEDLYFKNIVTNASLGVINEKNQIQLRYKPFIQEMNTEDMILYNYVKENIWPRYRVLSNDSDRKIKSSKLIRNYNKLDFEIHQRLLYGKTKINFKNLKSYYNRWIK